MSGQGARWKQKAGIIAESLDVSKKPGAGAGLFANSVFESPEVSDHYTVGSNDQNLVASESSQCGVVSISLFCA